MRIHVAPHDMGLPIKKSSPDDNTANPISMTIDLNVADMSSDTLRRSTGRRRRCHPFTGDIATFLYRAKRGVALLLIIRRDIAQKHSWAPS